MCCIMTSKSIGVMHKRVVIDWMDELYSHSLPPSTTDCLYSSDLESARSARICALRDDKEFKLDVVKVVSKRLASCLFMSLHRY